MRGSCSTNGEKRNACTLLVATPEGKRPLGRLRPKWEDIRMDLGEVGWGNVEWVGRAQVESSCEFGIEPSGSMKCWEAIE
jgi:hypothetical protein